MFSHLDFEGSEVSIVLYCEMPASTIPIAAKALDSIFQSVRLVGIPLIHGCGSKSHWFIW